MHNKIDYPNAADEIIFLQERKMEPDITNKDYVAARQTKYTKERLLVPMYRRIIEFNYNSELGNLKRI